MPVGEIRISDPDRTAGGRRRGEFRYARAYLNHPEARALDPVHLPLAPNVFSASAPESGLHGVFEDSLPDSWGRALLIRQHHLARSNQHPAYLLDCLGANGLGALVYSSRDEPPTPALSVLCGTEDLIEAAQRYERDPSSVEELHLRALFQAASSPGGARPKLLLEDQGRSCLAKLASAHDSYDIVRLEAASLALARSAGLDVPNFRIATFGRHTALLIERFDCANGGRRHMLSAQTLLDARGWYQLGYVDLADSIRAVSDAPERDLPMLYRQAVLNAILGNTDDHLKNFSLQDTDVGWCLTPAYDLLPDVLNRSEHVLHFGSTGHCPTQAALTALGRAFGLSAFRADSIRAEVAAAATRWIEFCDQAGVPKNQSLHFARDIERRLAH
ncbi:capsule biosynthesis enzymes related protein [Thiorhodovibrio frisius]|uniref:Capsule biosynthesis enzymes related protein n=1 Tax=Thiorhodovibrio frisius TaxID=631362 RepID=H8Z5M6_9GAMM|nr:capsule biosynthesis enzymes related protein [Thiorhodovibrio frisius]WPL21345.1 putative DNA-binding transcriptional regulator [Thiorhodovibrio frisius]